jgi:hypothetical protein
MTVAIDYFLLVGFCFAVIYWIKFNLVLIVKNKTEIRQDNIVGSRRFSNYFWSFFYLLEVRFLISWNI